MELNSNEVVNQATTPITPSLVVKSNNKPGKSHKVLFIILGIFIALILVVGIAGGYYFGRSSISNELNQVVPTIPPKDPDIYKGDPMPEAIFNETVDWKTYADSNLSYKYPSDWIQNGDIITASNPKIKITLVPGTTMFMDECMSVTKRETINNVYVKYYTSINSAPGTCSNSDGAYKEIWVTPSSTENFPGISISYDSNDELKVLPFINKILSTFKFTN